MKRKIFTLLAAVAVFTFAYSANKTLTVTPRSGAKTVELDGTAAADEAWADVTAVKMEAKKADQTPNNTAEFKMTYDNTNVYVYLKVTDATIDISHANVWERDCIELFFAMDTADASKYRPGDYQLRKVASVALTDGVAKGFKCAEEMTADGFTQEWELSWDSLKSTANFDKEYFRFEAQNGDNDGAGDGVAGRTGQLFWNSPADDQYASVKNQGFIKLSVKVGSVTGVKNANITSSISVKANSIELKKAADVTVIDMTGKIVLKATNVSSISTSSLKKGVYVVKSNNESRKFVK